MKLLPIAAESNSDQPRHYKPMSNYPPGMSKRDFIRAGIDQPKHYHEEHDWEPNDRDYPIFEDGAGIFSESCTFSYCDEMRFLRCDLDSVAKHGENITEEMSIEEFETAIMSVELASRDELSILAIDPPGYGDGYVRVQIDEYTVEYRE